MKARKYLAVILTIMMMVSAALAQTPAGQKEKSQQAAAATPVNGSGTPGQLSKWMGVDSSNSYTLGDSIIFEDKFGKLGIGTKTPTSLLTVKGMIETTLGGYKFPDGTIQTTAGMGSVIHDATLKGNGTSNSPLGIALPLTLKGTAINTLLIVQNTSTSGGDGALFEGGSTTSSGSGGTGVRALGGNNTSGTGGNGMAVAGGASDSSFGGIGIFVRGGGGNNASGGTGLDTQGGDASGMGEEGGYGIVASSGVGFDGAAYGKAALFSGNVEIIKHNNTGGNLSVIGMLSKGGGTFKIDHPLDPENKYLYHSFVESPDMMNIYNGNITTDANGEAIITMPDYFEALNRDFRYQLTVIGTFAQAIVADEISGNRFTIKTTAPNVKVSWQVTGVRQDAFANAHRVKVEENKPQKERGYYLYPTEHKQPEEKSIDYVRNPELMKREKESRENARKEKQL
jgi:hypothetical protein